MQLDPVRELKQVQDENAYTCVRYSYRQVHILIQREGWQLGKNQAYRLYNEEQLH